MEFNEPSELAVARVAAAIGEPARTRILFCLMDGHARTSTELAIIAGISPSTASVHLHRLQAERLGQVACPGQASLLQPCGQECCRCARRPHRIGWSFPPAIRSEHAQSIACRARLLRSHRGNPWRFVARPVESSRLGGGPRIQARRGIRHNTRWRFRPGITWDRRRRNSEATAQVCFWLSGLERAETTSRGRLSCGDSGYGIEKEMAASRTGQPRTFHHSLRAAPVTVPVRVESMNGAGINESAFEVLQIVLRDLTEQQRGR